MMGLKNCLRAAARHDVHHITLPLLLVHEMQPVRVWRCAMCEGGVCESACVSACV